MPEALSPLAPQANAPRKRRTSVTVQRPEIIVPDPKNRPSSSGRFVAVELPSEEPASRPGPVGRWVLLGLIVVGFAAVGGYAWLRSAQGLSVGHAARAAPAAVPRGVKTH